MGQDVKVEALVSETTIGTEEAVGYTIEIGGSNLTSIDTPQPPETEGLVLQQSIPSTQRNISFVNGQLSQSLAFQWTYRPAREGTARFLPAEVTINGEAYRTEAIQVTVVPQAQRPQRPQRSRRDPFASPFSQRDDPDDEPARSNVGQRDLFIRAIPSTHRAYQNEQVTIEYQLFFRNFIQPRHSRLADSWDAEGFWREELEVESRPMPRVTVENGLRYNYIALKRVAVFPTRSGTLQIDPLRIETEVFAPRGSDPFGRLFSLNNPYETIDRASPAVTIESRPLPPDAPPGFNGAVGQYDLNVRVNRTDVKVGEPVQVMVEISGTGNLALMEAPPIQAPGIFETYDPEVDLSLNTSGQRVRGSKTFTYLLVPRSNGTFTLPPITFSFFDPDAAQYRTLRADPTEVHVTGTASAPAASSTPATGLPVDDIAPLITQADWTQRHRTPLHQSPWTYVLLTLPLLALGLLAGYRRYATRLATDTAYARSRKAHPLARKHLKQAEALQQHDQPRAFYEELERAVLGFVGNRLNVAELGLTRPQLDARLAEEGINASTREALRRLLETCDLARFSPECPTPDQMDASLDEARRLIIAIDDALIRQPAAEVAEG